MKRRKIVFFAQTLENSKVLIYLLFNEIQTSFCPCLRLTKFRDYFGADTCPGKNKSADR